MALVANGSPRILAHGHQARAVAQFGNGERRHREVCLLATVEECKRIVDWISRNGDVRLRPGFNRSLTMHLVTCLARNGRLAGEVFANYAPWPLRILRLDKISNCPVEVHAVTA